MLRSCPICGLECKREYKVPTPFLDHREIYEIFRCRSCGHRFAVGNTAADFLRRIYGGHFHDSSQQSAELLAETPAEESAPVVINALERSRWLHAMELHGRLLDIGAGRGYFLKAAERYFESVEGVDLSEDAAAHGARLGLKIRAGDFLAEDYQPGTFDVVTMWDVLASLPDARSALRKVHALLKPGGHLIMTVPLGDSFVARLTGRFWPLLIPPVNLDYFSRRSLSLLLMETGFSVQRAKCVGKWVSLQFLATKLVRSLRLYGLEAHMKAIPPHWKIPINLFDILTVVVQRRV